MAEARRAYVMGADPGTTTGMALIMFDAGDGGRPTKVWADQQDWHEACDTLSRRLEEMRVMRDAQDVQTFVVGEMYIINPQTARRGQEGAQDALGMLGVLRHLCRLTGCEYRTQTASSAKKLVVDDVLRNLHIKSPGLLHADDAARQALLFAVRTGLMDAAWLVWNPEKPRGRLT